MNRFRTHAILTHVGMVQLISTIICYNIIGDITIRYRMTMTVDSDLNGASPQFTLTCISTGGPATTVTWTRGSGTVVGDEVTVFNTSSPAYNAQYTHTLTVTGRLTGLYQCNVSNDKPSQASRELYVRGIYLETLYNIHVYMYWRALRLHYVLSDDTVDANHHFFE